MLKRVGFYVELNSSDDPGYLSGSLRDAMGATADPLEDQIVGYLGSGHRVLNLMEGMPDVLTGEYGFPGASGAPSLLTDGVWLWRLDLAYYVRQYHLALPSEFREHVIANNFIVAPLGEKRRREIDDWITSWW